MADSATARVPSAPWLARRDALLFDTAAQLLRSPVPQAIVDDLCRKVMEFLDCQAYFNYLSDPRTGRLCLNAWAGVSAEEAGRIETLEPGEEVCGCVARDGTPIIVENVQEGADPRAAAVRSFGMQAYVCHPLQAHDRLLGTLSFGSRTRVRFRPEEIGMMEAVSNLVAIAMDQIASKKALARQAAVLDGINRILGEALSSTDVDDLGRMCLAVAEALTGSQFGFIEELNPEGRLDDLVISGAGWDACRVLRPDRRSPLKGFEVRGIYGLIVREGRSLIANDPARHPDRVGLPDGHPPLTSFLGVPLVREGRVFGLIAVGNREGGYADEQREALETLAPAIVQALDRKRAQAELAVANRELVDADRRKDEFLAMLGHELRNPLAAITTALDILRNPGASEEERARAREVGTRQTRHMRRLVDDLLDVSRITRGKVTLQKEIVALADVVAAAVESERPALERAGLRLRLELPTDRVKVRGDSVRLAQIVGNLVNNSVKFSPPGGIVRVAVGRQDGGAEIRVSDQGAGIEPELLPRIFDLFVQGDDGPGRVQGGLGIGLTMVKRLVELHGGQVEAASAGRGRGSEFRVRLPLVDTGGTWRGERMPEKGPARRVLIVDDHADEAELLAMVMSKDGHLVAVAFGPEEALEKAPLFRPDVVLLDIGLPGMDGYELARRLRGMPELAGAKLVAHTGYGAEEDRERSREAGIDRHLVKPVSLETLRKVLGD